MTLLGFCFRKWLCPQAENYENYENLKIMWKFGLFKDRKMFQFLSKLSFQVLDHFNDELVFLRIWITKMKNMSKKPFPTPIMNNKGQQICLHIIEYNSSSSQDGS